MGKSAKKPRKKVNLQDIGSTGGQAPKKKEKDWSFDEIARSKGRGRTF